MTDAPKTYAQGLMVAHKIVADAHKRLVRQHKKDPQNGTIYVELGSLLLEISTEIWRASMEEYSK